ncbi:hypothetical protein ARSEF1564_003742 [Beauveria bassiana]
MMDRILSEKVHSALAFTPTRNLQPLWVWTCSSPCNGSPRCAPPPNPPRISLRQRAAERIAAEEGPAGSRPQHAHTRSETHAARTRPSLHTASKPRTRAGALLDDDNEGGGEEGGEV